MRKKIFTYFIGRLVFLMLESFGGEVGNPKYPYGSPGGYSGSPADGHNCTACHGGAAATVTGWITSNVPATGYIPGTAYTITVTISGTGAKGFEVSPQSISGTLIGTLSAGSGQILVNGNKAITQTSSNSANPASWSFTWTAPAVGAGPVTFYGSLCVKKSTTKLCTLVIPEESNGITGPVQGRLSVYPNPCDGTLYLKGLSQDSEISLYSVDGKLVHRSITGISAQTEKLELKGKITTGIYLLEMQSHTSKYIEKIIIR